MFTSKTAVAKMNKSYLNIALRLKSMQLSSLPLHKWIHISEQNESSAILFSYNTRLNWLDEIGKRNITQLPMLFVWIRFIIISLIIWFDSILNSVNKRHLNIRLKKRCDLVYRLEGIYFLIYFKLKFKYICWGKRECKFSWKHEIYT